MPSFSYLDANWSAEQTIVTHVTFSTVSLLLYAQETVVHKIHTLPQPTAHFSACSLLQEQ